MEELGKDKLKKAIGQLASKTAPIPWDAIEEELDEAYPTDRNHTALQKAIHELPNKTVDSALFDSIIADTTAEQAPPKAKRYWLQDRSYHKLSWAASIALLLVSSLIWWPNNTEQVNIVYTEQRIELAPKLFEFTELHQQDEVLSFVKANCKAFQLACSQEEFKELLEQYMQLESDRKELMEVIQQNQEEKQLVTYLVRLEKKKTALGKKLMQTFI